MTENNPNPTLELSATPDDAATIPQPAPIGDPPAPAPATPAQPDQETNPAGTPAETT